MQIVDLPSVVEALRNTYDVRFANLNTEDGESIHIYLQTTPVSRLTLNKVYTVCSEFFTVLKVRTHDTIEGDVLEVYGKLRKPGCRGIGKKTKSGVTDIASPTINNNNIDNSTKNINNNINNITNNITVNNIVKVYRFGSECTGHLDSDDLIRLRKKSIDGSLSSYYKELDIYFDFALHYLARDLRNMNV